MIKVGQRKSTKYWGRRTVIKVARLKKPVECCNPEQGVVLFQPTIVQIEWERHPSRDKNEFWFPYWMTIGGKEKYGQFAPMMGEKTLLELLQDAIKQDFFSKAFLRGLDKVVIEKLAKNEKGDKPLV